MNPQFNNPENYDFTPNPQTVGHVLNNGDPNQFFNNSDGIKTILDRQLTWSWYYCAAGTYYTELEFGNVTVGYDYCKKVDIVNNTDVI